MVRTTSGNFVHVIMSAIFILIAASLIVALGFLGAFIWSVKTGQYDDDYTPSVRMLFDDKLPSKKETTLTDNNSIKNKDQYGTRKI